MNTSALSISASILEEGKSGPAGRLLQEQSIRRKELLKTLEDVRGGQRVTNRNPEDTLEALENTDRISRYWHGKENWTR